MKVGQKVKIVNHYQDDKYNPRNVTGEVVSVDGRYNPIIVEWDNGIRNSYSSKSLEAL